MSEIFYFIYKWSLSDLYIAATSRGICKISFAKNRTKAQFIESLKMDGRTDISYDTKKFNSVSSALDTYLKGESTRFDVPLDFIMGTDFQKNVWKELMKIPYGRTVSYADIARRIKKPRAMRAVGSANGANPIPIIVPCHRVIQSNGNLGGYSSGLDLKITLLKLEGVQL